MRVTVVAPLFDDWECLGPFLGDLAATTAPDAEVDVLIVDDGSPTRPDVLWQSDWDGLRSIEILHLATNLGHQRAICIGLCETTRRADMAGVVVIDSDGEDRPAEIRRLMAAANRDDTSIAVAQRSKRTEAIPFKVFYRFYRLIFSVLTGQRLDFGNFAYLSPAAVRRLAYMSELWNHFPSAVMRSRLRITREPIDRGVRYAGRSRMNFFSLASHGLSAVASYGDVMFVRLTLIAGVSLVLLVGAIIAAVVVQLTAGLTGWAIVFLTVALLATIQILVALVVALFLVLSSRLTPSVPPIVFTADYIEARELITP